MITNINTNKVNEIVDNELIFDSSNSPSHNPVQDPLPMVTIILIFSKNPSTVKCRHINPYKSKIMTKKLSTTRILDCIKQLMM